VILGIVLHTDEAALRVWQYLLQCVSDGAITSTFVDSNSSLHTIVREISALAVALFEIFTKNSRPARENWVHIQHYFQGVAPRPVTFFK
jgi:hypothetical protein